jgi:hypothetical protein
MIDMPAPPLKELTLMFTTYRRQPLSTTTRPIYMGQYERLSAFIFNEIFELKANKHPANPGVISL